jgi:hypothetical protein
MSKHPGSSPFPLTIRPDNMANEFCQKCKQAHPGCLCDYDDKGNCAEVVDVSEEEVEESMSTTKSPNQLSVARKSGA